MSNEVPNTNPTPAGTPAPAEQNPPPTPDPKKEAAAGTPDPAKQDATPPAKEGEAGKEPAKKEEQAKPVVPEKYELKAPEGIKFDNATLEKVAADAKALGLTQDQAQALLERDLKAASSWEQAQIEDLKKQTDEEWPKLVQSDKELGGDNYSKNVELAHRTIAKFGSEQFVQDLKASGFGNHPELLRTFFRIGKAMAEDSIFVPRNEGAAEGGVNHAQVLYGKTTPSN